MHRTAQTPRLSTLVEEKLAGLSPIQTIMKMAEDRNILDMGLDPHDVISFGGGWCNHAAPPELIDVYAEIVADQQLFHRSGRYSAIVGDWSCREQLCELEARVFGLAGLDPENIILGQSSTQLFHDVLRVLVNPGEPVLFLDPTYANYTNALKCALPGSRMHFIKALDTHDWTYLKDPDTALEELEHHCSNGVRALVVPVPDNPTSQIPPDRFLEHARQVLEDYHGFLVLDHAYKALWFGEMPGSFRWSPVEKTNLVTLHSNSKWLSSLGRRLGWAEASPEVISGLEKLNESVLLSPDTMHSMATARYLGRAIAGGSLLRYIEHLRELYASTAGVMLAALDRHLGWKRLVPQGGLYTCCPTPNGEEPVAFVQRVLRGTGVLMIPGKGFGPSMETAVRLSYGPLCYSHDRIAEGMERVGEYLNSGNA